MYMKVFFQNSVVNVLSCSIFPGPPAIGDGRPELLSHVDHIELFESSHCCRPVS